MTTSPTHLSGHVHGEEAVRAGVLALAPFFPPDTAITENAVDDREFIPASLEHIVKAVVSAYDTAAGGMEAMPQHVEAVEIVARHRYLCGSDRGVSPRWEQCACGEKFVSTADVPAWRLLAVHQADVLAAAGLLATEQEWAVNLGTADDPRIRLQAPWDTTVTAKAHGGTVVSRGVTPWREATPSEPNPLPPFTAEELSMDMGKDGTYPFTEGESAEITGYGHQDKAAFAAEINRYDRAMNGESWDEEGWTAKDISHQWAVRNTEETCTVYVDRGNDERVTPVTPGAFPITTLWNAR